MAAVTSLARFATGLFAVSLFVGAQSARAAQAYIVVDSQSGYILQEANSKEKHQVGSLTKIATASVVLDWAEHKGGDLNQYATIPQQAFVGAVENDLGLQPGDRMQLRDLLYAALVQSSNIAAYTLANHVGSQFQSMVQAPAGTKAGPVDIFVGQMNALAKSLKMERTRFVNPSGVDDKVRPMPYSTAEDMARVTRYAMDKASFRFYVSQKERLITFQRNGKEEKRMLKNTNELLGRNGIDGVKTGRTAHAGDCVILSAGRESEVVKNGQMVTVFPRHIIVVVLASTNRFGEGGALINTGWQLYDQWAGSGRVVTPEKVL